MNSTPEYGSRTGPVIRLTSRTFDAILKAQGEGETSLDTLAETSSNMGLKVSEEMNRYLSEGFAVEQIMIDELTSYPESAKVVIYLTKKESHNG